MDPTKTTQTPATGAPDAMSTDTMSVPGAGTAASTTPGALDFTGNNTGVGGLSMADSLASAQDNLTSAGMAANDPSNATLDLSQLGSSNPQASMDRPDEPLVPAAPVPGSIGSVTSGPAMAADASATQPATGTPAAAETPAAAPYNPFAPADLAAAPQTQVPADATAPVSAPAAQPDMSQTSSTSVPTALQPKTSKFSMKGDKPSMLTWILGIAAGVFAVAMIIFMVLWIQGMGKEKVVYVPNTVRPEPVQTSAVCTMDREAGADDGMDGLTGIASTVNLNFSDDKLTNYDVLARYTFGEAAQAEASRPLFATMASIFTAVGAGSDGSPLSASYNVSDNAVTLDMKTDVESALENEDITLDLPVDEASGEYLLDAVSIKEYLGNQGYVCE